MSTLADPLGGAADSGIVADHSCAANAPNRFAEQALARNKQESLDLAVKARWIALVVIAILLPFINPRLEVVYYEALLCGFALIGWAQRRIGRLGQSRSELFLMFCDLALLTVISIAPNPISNLEWPLAMQYRFDNFIYFFVLLAGATLAYSWRTVLAMGVWTTGLWFSGVFLIWLVSGGNFELTDAAKAAFGSYERMAEILDPNNIRFEIRVQEVVVFLIVAATLALAARRGNSLLIGHAGLERERANLERYFSPNMVEELSQNDEPLKAVRNQNIAVLFVDIVGFTAFAADKTPEQVIDTLRAFHGRMENEVFRHYGTLDKYLGDGLMATFGTPSAGDRDARNALRCARAMAASVGRWNIERAAAGEPAIRASFGIHYGPVVLGDIGKNRLEFAVIGNTVNIASRVEALTRELGVILVASDAMMARTRQEPGGEDGELEGFSIRPGQVIRGIERPMTVWTFT
jgi:adenylate cyclase